MLPKDPEKHNEYRKKLSVSGKRRFENFEEHQKISKAMKGRKLTDKHKKKISIATKGKNNPIYGKFGKLSPNWKGGFTFNKEGRKYIYMPNHPNACNGRYVLESRLIVEKVLGRYLKPHEVVHHINRDFSKNENSNLLLCSRSYHAWLHTMIKKNLKGGDEKCN